MAAHGAPASVRYEGYGPGGVAVLIDCLTADPDRTVAGLRHAFAMHGGHLGAEGAVRYLFNAAGVIVLPPCVNVPAATDTAYEAGAEDVVSDEDGHTIYCAFEDINEVSKALEAVLGEASSVKAIWKPQNTIEVDEEKAQSLMKLIDTLEDDDDVQNVYSNFEVSDEVMAKLSA